MTEISSSENRGSMLDSQDDFITAIRPVCLTVKEAVMTQVQQFHRRIAVLFVVSLGWVALVVSMYATTS